MPDTRTASCNCGAIRIEARGQPMRVGLCHCINCRKAGGASWKDTTVSRHFCPSCGSVLFGASDGAGEIAIGLGAFDVAPTGLAPTYELWAGRREKWLEVVTPTEQFPGPRTAVG